MYKKDTPGELEKKFSIISIILGQKTSSQLCTQFRLLPKQSTDTTTPPIRVIIPFKDQVSANVVKKRLPDLSSKIRTIIQSVFVSRKLNEGLKVREVKPATVNQQCVVYNFQCNLCDAGYVGYIRGHLHERVDGHKQKSPSICKHYFGDHNSNVPPCLSEQFYVLTQFALRMVSRVTPKRRLLTLIFASSHLLTQFINYFQQRRQYEVHVRHCQWLTKLKQNGYFAVQRQRLSVLSFFFIYCS